jgi:hypothetical protein
MELSLMQLLSVASPIFAIGGAWGGAKVALNGTRERVKRIHRELDQHMQHDEEMQRDTIDRLARIETKLDLLTRS